MKRFIERNGIAIAFVVIALVVLIPFVRNSKKNVKESRIVESKLIAQMAALNPPSQVGQDDQKLWSQVVKRAHICRECSNFAEFNSSSPEQATYPLIYSVYDKHQALEYTMVIGTVTFHYPSNSEPMLQPQIAYYERNIEGSLRRFSPLEGAFFEDMGGRWEPLPYGKDERVIREGIMASVQNKS